MSVADQVKLGDKPEEDLLILTHIAEDAERYEDMKAFIVALMQKKMKNSEKISEDEQILYSVACKNIVSVLRSSWRALIREEEPTEAVLSYIKIIEERLIAACKDIISFLEKELIPLRKDDNDHAQIFCLKMAADYYRYIAELFAIDNNKDLSSDENVIKAQKYYQDATELAKKNLDATHPTTLGIALNYSVFFYEILKKEEDAVETGKKAFDAAIGALDTLDGDHYKDSTLILQLIRDNLTLWSTVGCERTANFGVAMTTTEFILTIACLSLSLILIIVLIINHCLRKKYLSKISIIQAQLDEATRERKQAKSFANALTGAYETNVDAARIRKDLHLEAKNKMNEDYLNKDEYVNSDLPEDLRADTYNNNYNNGNNGSGNGARDPMLNDHVVVSNEDDLLANQVIVPVVSDVSDDLNRIGSNSTSIHNNNNNNNNYNNNNNNNIGGIAAPLSMSSAAAKNEKEMMEIQRQKQNQNQNQNNLDNLQQRIGSSSPPDSPRNVLKKNNGNNGNNGNNNSQNKFNIARQAALAMEKRKKQGNQSPVSHSQSQNRWKKRNNNNNNNNNNNINSNNKNNNGNHVQNPSDIPPIPPVPDLPPQMQQQMAQLLPKANNSDMDNYGPLPVDNAAPAAGMNGMNNVAGLASSHDSDDDDDIILPPKDGFGMTGNVGAPPARGGRNGKQKVFPPKKKGNHQDVAMNMAIKMSGEGGGNGSGSDAPGSPGQVEGKGRPSDILALDDDDAFLDDMYAPVGKKKSLDTPGDGDGMTGDTPGGNGPPGGKPPRPIVEDDEIDVLDV